MQDKPKRGRPPLPEAARLAQRIEVRLSVVLAEKLRRLGGVDWIRERIRRAKEPPASG